MSSFKQLVKDRIEQVNKETAEASESAKSQLSAQTVEERAAEVQRRKLDLAARHIINSVVIPTIREVQQELHGHGQQDSENYVYSLRSDIGQKGQVGIFVQAWPLETMVRVRCWTANSHIDLDAEETFNMHHSDSHEFSIEPIDEPVIRAWLETQLLGCVDYYQRFVAIDPPRVVNYVRRQS